MADVAQLQVVVGADVSDAEKGLASLSSKVESAGSGIAKAFGVAAAAGVAGFTAALGLSVKEAADFEKTMSGVAAVSGATADELSKLSDLALKLGADTSFSATEAAQGIEELTKAGVSMSDVMGGAAKASLDLAAAGGVSVADAATIASNAMNQFSLKGADMGHVADLIAGAANASALDVSDFKFSLQAAGAVASTVGFSFDDLAEAIAVMGQAGITGSDAGTSLKTMMMSLQPSTKAAKDMMQELGIITKNGSNAFFDASGKVKSMAEVAEVLQEALKGQTEQQKLATLQTLFGSDAIRAAAVMAKAGAEGFEEMAASMGKVSAADVAEKRLDNLAGSIEKLKGSLSTIAIVIGRAFIPAIRSVVDAGTSMLNRWMPAITAFAQTIPSAIDQTVAAFTAFGQYMSFVLETGDTMNDFLVDLPEPIHDVTKALGDVVVWLAKTAASFAGIAVEDYVSPWEMVSDAVSYLATELRVTLGAALTWVTQTGLPLLGGALGVVATYITSVFLPILGAAWDWLAPKLQSALSWLATTGFPLMQKAISTVGDWLRETGIPTLKTLWSWLSEKLGDAVSWLRDRGWPLLQKAMSTVYDWLTGPFFETLGVLWDWLSPKLQAALNWLVLTGWPAFQTAMGAVWSWLNETLFPTLGILYDWLANKISAVLNWLAQTGWPAVQTAMSSVATTIQTQVVPWFQALFVELDKRQVIQDVATFINNISAAASSLISQFFPSLVGGFQDTDSAAAGAAPSVSSVAQAIKDVTSALAEWSKSGPYDYADWVLEWAFYLRHKLWEASEVLVDIAEWIGQKTGLPTGVKHTPEPPLTPDKVARPSSAGSTGGGTGNAGAPGSSSGGGGGVPSGGGAPIVSPVPTGGALPNNPEGWYGLAQAVAGEFGIPADTFAKQMRHESAGFAEDVIWQKRSSSAGARGIAQFMTGTGNGVAAQMGVSLSDFWASPLLQLRGGAFHMAELLGRYGGDAIAALVAYNAGTGNGDYLKPYLGNVRAELAELETWRDQQPRQYIKAILGYERGGWAGLHGPELAVLGESGPEYVVPHNALRSGTGGGLEHVVVDVMIGGRMAERIYVTGRDLAMQRARSSG